MSNSIMTEYRAELGIIFLILFSIASFLGLIGAFMGSDLPGGWDIFQDLITPIGSWAYWLSVIGPLGLIVTLWWDFDYFFKIRKLKEYMDTSSKAKFLKNLDDVEYLAWRLPRKYKMMVAEKKKELKITK